MRLISWNVMRATGGRLRAQADYLQTQQPDIVALQEVTNGSVAEFQSELARIGLPCFANSFSLAADPAVPTGPRRYGEILAGRWPLRTLPPEGFTIPWRERVLSAVVAAPFGHVEVHTAHIPPGVTNGRVKVETLEGIYKRLAQPADTPRILCGDFNTPQAELPKGEVVTWGQVQVRSSAVRFHRGRGERWDAAERNVLVGLGDFDLADVYRRLHGYAVEEFSWAWRGRGRSIGRRFDHIFASGRLTPLQCRYDHSVRMDVPILSDHSAMEADFACDGRAAP